MMTLADIPTIIIQGEEVDLCRTDRQLALETLQEKALSGIPVYTIEIGSGGHRNNIMAAIVSDNFDEVRYHANALADHTGYMLASMYSDPQMINWAIWRIEPNANTKVDFGGTFCIPEVCRN